jgi:hypothetical protein
MQDALFSVSTNFSPPNSRYCLFSALCILPFTQPTVIEIYTYDHASKFNGY